MTIYRLSEKEQELIAVIELNASLSAQEIARRLRWRPHTVQYLLTKLINNQVIRRAPFIDIHKLGLRYCGVFLSVQGNAKQKASFISNLKHGDRVGWVAELAGPFQYGIAIAVNNPKEVDSFLFELMKHTQVKIYKKAVAFRLHLTDTPRQYLTKQKIERASLSIGDGVDTVEIDDLDKNILGLLSSSNELSYRDMASSLGIAHTSFDLRIKRLKKLEVLVGNTLEVDLRWLQRECFKMLVYARGKETSLSHQLQDYAIKQPLISHYVECLGQWDYELNIEIASPTQLSIVIDELQDKFGDRINDILALKILKVHRVNRYPFSKRS